MDSDDYPQIDVSEAVTSYFDKPIRDPYRGLEKDSEERKDWLASQQRLTDSYLAEKEYRSSVEDVVTAAWDYKRMSTPRLSDDYLYYFLNHGLEDHSSLYRSPRDGDVIEGREVFVKPALFDGEDPAITSYAVSDSGAYVAVLVSSDGQDWQRLHVFDARNGEQVIDPIDNVKFSRLSWLADEQVLFSLYPSSDDASSANSHELRACHVETGDTRSVFGHSEEYQFVSGLVSDDNTFIVVLAAQTTGGDAVYVKRVGDKSFTEYVAEDDHEFKFLGHDNEELLFETDHDAPNKRVVSIPHDNPCRSAWTTVVEEQDRPMEVSSAGGYLFARMVEDARHTVTQYDYSGNHVADVSLPGKGHVHGFSGSRTDTVVYFTYMDHLTPPTVLRYDMKGGSEAVFEPSVALDPDEYVSYQVFYTSKDGTEIPMTITHHEDVEPDGANPVMMSGYGGFGMSVTPTFTASKAAWLELGGVYAEPNLRGGGEYGESWHEQGKKMSKQNVFDDFIAAAEHLIDEEYTRPELLAVTGASNGGLLVGAVLTQRPGLIGVALPRSGVYDMLRYDEGSIGGAWSDEYGLPDDSEAMFEYLRSYSPYHNVEDEAYPATLLYTAENDDRVVPWHTYKFTAALQAHTESDEPILLHTHEMSGHGAYRSTTKQIDEVTDRLTFTVDNIGHNAFQLS